MKTVLFITSQTIL